MTDSSLAVSARDWRPFVYGGLDVVHATALYMLFSKVAISFAPATRALSLALVFLFAAMGVAMLTRRAAGWWVGAVGCGLLLAAAAYLLAQTVHSAAFLAGVYGAFGRGAASLAMLAAALVVAFLGLFPALQLKYLMTRAGRRSFARARLGPRA